MSIQPKNFNVGPVSPFSPSLVNDNREGGDKISGYEFLSGKGALFIPHLIMSE